MPYRNILFYIILPCILWAPSMERTHAGASPPVVRPVSVESGNTKKAASSSEKKQAQPSDENKKFYEALDSLYTTPEFKQASPQEKEKMSEDTFFRLKRTLRKRTMGLRLARSLLSWGVIGTAWYLLPKFIKWLFELDKSQEIVKKIYKDHTAIVAIISTLCKGIGYFWQFAHSRLPQDSSWRSGLLTYLQKITTLTGKSFIPDNELPADTEEGAFIFCVEKLAAPLEEAILLGIIYAIFRGENPFPTNLLTLLLFIAAPRGYLYIYIGLRFFWWLYTKGYAQLYMPAVAVMMGGSLSEFIQPAQVAYVRERHTLRKDLQQSIEAKLLQAQNKGTRQAAVKAMTFIKQALKMHKATSRTRDIPVTNSFDKVIVHYQRFHADMLEKKFVHYDKRTIRAFANLVQCYLHGKPKRYLISGSEGVGKTFATTSLSPFLQGSIVSVNLSQCSASQLTGTRNTPGRLVASFIKNQKPAAILLFDKLDQLAESPSATSKNVLDQLGRIFDKKNKNTFYSPYFQASFPLPSTVIFTFTTTPDNRSPSQILPKSLVDGSEHIKLPGYTAKQKVAMALDFYLPLVCDNLQIDRKNITPIDRQYIEEEIRKLDGVDAIDVEAAVYRCVRTRQQYRKQHRQPTMSKQKSKEEAKATPKEAPKKPFKKPKESVKKPTPPPAPVNPPAPAPAKKETPAKKEDELPLVISIRI